MPSRSSGSAPSDRGSGACCGSPGLPIPAAPVVNMLCSRARLKPVAFLVFCIAGLPACPCGATSAALPTAYDANDLLLSGYTDVLSPSLRLSAGAVAAAMNNVGSLWQIADREQPPRRFEGASAYATIETAEWTRIAGRGWWIGYGTGRRDDYDGNADAAQLWTDIHSGGQTKPAYRPEAANVRIAASWVGAGREFAFGMGSARGTGSICLRLLTAGDYLARAVTGEVSGEQFSGMVRITSARTEAGKVEGSGWALDAQWRFLVAGRLRGRVSAEGLLGRLGWRGLLVRDAYVTSPGVFTDPQGFLHDCGGISGAEWRENVSASLNTCWRIDLVSAARPQILLNGRFQAGARPLVGFGLAWPQRRPWTPYLRCYPSQHRLEAGAVGRGWQLRVSGDDWLGSSPKHAEIGISAAAAAF